MNNAGQISAQGYLAGGGSSAVRLDPVAGSLGQSGAYPAESGRSNRLALRGATPGMTLAFAYSTVLGATAVPGCVGLMSELGAAQLAGTAVVNAHGSRSWT